MNKKKMDEITFEVTFTAICLAGALFLLALGILLAGCHVQCDGLPRKDYTLVLENRGPASPFCYSQEHAFDLTDDETLAASFLVGCEVTVYRGCEEMTLHVVCPQADVSCSFVGLRGQCENDLGDGLVCRYDAALRLVSP